MKMTVQIRPAIDELVEWQAFARNVGRLRGGNLVEGYIPEGVGELPAAGGAVRFWPAISTRKREVWV